MPLKIYAFSKHSDLELHLRGGIKVGPSPKAVHNKVFGLHGLTLVFIQPAAATATFDDAVSEGLSLVEIIEQIKNSIDTPAITTEGTTALSALTMASETLTLFLDGSVTPTSIVFGLEAGEAPILAVLNAALNPLGVTATVGTGTPGGVVLTSDDGGADKSIQITATGGGQAKLTMAVGTVTGASVILPRFKDGCLELVEATPVSGVRLNLATSTALTIFGWSGEQVAGSTHTGTVYDPEDGVAPRFLNWSGTSDGAGYLLLTEEL